MSDELTDESEVDVADVADVAEAPNAAVARPPLLRGCLYLVATPIGNLEDITLRAIRVLSEADLIAAEDTRTTRKLLAALGLHKPLLSLFEANEAQRIPQILERLRAGEIVAVVSEAGTPSLSDPGHRLNRACVEAGLPVDAIPGPAAAINALLLSALPPGRFRFLGFLPRRGSARRALLGSIAEDGDTSIFYEAPRRLLATLQDLQAVLPAAREVAVVREMTKLYQQVLRGSLQELIAHCSQTAPRGEITVVVAGRSDESARADVREGLEEQISARLAEGESPRQIADALRQPGLPRREVYQLALHLAERQESPG